MTIFRRVWHVLFWDFLSPKIKSAGCGSFRPRHAPGRSRPKKTRRWTTMSAQDRSFPRSNRKLGRSSSVPVAAIDLRWNPHSSSWSGNGLATAVSTVGCLKSTTSSLSKSITSSPNSMRARQLPATSPLRALPTTAIKARIWLASILRPASGLGSSILAAINGAGTSAGTARASSAAPQAVARQLPCSVSTYHIAFGIERSSSPKASFRPRNRCGYNPVPRAD